MFQDSSEAFTHNTGALARAAGHAAQAGGLGASLLLRLLDEIDYGLMLVSDNGRVRMANRPARAECASGGALRLEQGRLDAINAADQAALLRALAGAQQGRRTMLRVGRASQAVDLAVVPLAGTDDDDDTGAAHALVVIGKRQVCEALSVEMFARAHRLTAAEGNVLQALCNGLEPTSIARQFGVAVSTIRTQVSSIRLKTAAGSIRDLVKQVAVLPPIVNALRNESAAAWH
jgi:DNA-binding CsgD family transcriptional regulator